MCCNLNGYFKHKEEIIMKKILSLALVAMLALGISVPSLAADNITIYADGSAVVYSEASPVRENGTVMAPVRATFESMAAQLQMKLLWIATS